MAAQASLSLTWPKTPKTGFLMTRLNSMVSLSNKTEANSAGQDQTAPKTDQGLLCLPFLLHLLDALLQQSFQESQYLQVLRKASLKICHTGRLPWKRITFCETHVPVTLLDDNVIQSQLHFCLVYNSLLYRVLRDESENSYLLFLSNTMGSILQERTNQMKHDKMTRAPNQSNQPLLSA